MKMPHYRWLDYAVLTCAFFLIIHDLQAPLFLSDSSYMQAYAATEGTGRPGKQIGIVILFLYGSLACLFTRRRIFNLNSPLTRLGLAFLVLITLSISWSAAPAASAARWAGFIAYTLAAAGAVKRLASVDVIRWYLLAHCLYLVGGLVNEIVLGTFNPLGAGYRFTGFSDPNTTGIDAVVLVFSSMAMLRIRPGFWVYRATLLAGVSFLLLTKSRSALLSTAFTSIIIYGVVSLRGMRRIRYLSVLALFASALLFFYSLDFINFKSALSLGRTEASENTMTGRLPLWTELYEKGISKHPLVGYGYGGFWTPQHDQKISSDQGWQVGAAHSIYLDATLSLGVIGLFLYLTILLLLLYRAIREARRGRQDGWFFGCLVLCALFDGFSSSEAWFISSIYLFGCIQALVAVSAMAIEPETVNKRQEAITSYGSQQGIPSIAT